jgi:hypothetical protein
VPCSASRVVPGAHRVVGPGTHRGSGPREVHTTAGFIWIECKKVVSAKCSTFVVVLLSKHIDATSRLDNEVPIKDELT